MSLLTGWWGRRRFVTLGWPSVSQKSTIKVNWTCPFFDLQSWLIQWQFLILWVLNFCIAQVLQTSSVLRQVLEIAEVTMPQMPKREILEQTGQLEVYQSAGEPRACCHCWTYGIRPVVVLIWKGVMWAEQKHESKEHIQTTLYCLYRFSWGNLWYSSSQCYLEPGVHLNGYMYI